MYTSYIGLEIHIRLLTKSKVFCSCESAYGDEPNTRVCPVCLGYPGVLPTLNQEAIRMAYLVARSLGCELGTKAMFDRKNYYYPDMPKNYQISQFHSPVGRNGTFEIEIGERPKSIGIHDVHLEEDAGKMIHSQGASLIDFNRAGTSLLEIVTEPDIETAEEAEVFIQSFRRIVRYLGVCNGNMEEGSLRCDANVSCNLIGKGLGTKTEVKNMNSSRFAKKALQYEIKRQKKILQQGGEIVQETRLWDETKGVTSSMRTKESAHDYRYFPEPDLPPFVPTDEFLSALEESLIELPLTRKNRFQGELGIKSDFAEFLTDEKATADFFEEVLGLGGDPSIVANWLAGYVQAQLKRAGVDNVTESYLTPKRLIELIELVQQNRISANNGKKTLEIILRENHDPEAIVKEHGLEQIGDASKLNEMIEKVIAKNPDPAKQIEQGNMKPLGFLVGQVMKLSCGQADPKEVSKILRERFGL
ncbi:MAG: Asp-tRNA(Asn)/Glu-tRNA(Gln) amidotransferase subunit GatB [Proteobacteria bacterium]|nr:Asp-tRNA(Asn)/Glu-tRNA(Gln) amidotransferase subunit GatB [Pseudomonadota bacterium]